MTLFTFFRADSRIGICIRIAIFLLLPVLSFAQSNSCAAPTALTSSTACVNTAGTLAAATYTAATGLPGIICAVANADVWYSFVAFSTNPTITLAQTSGAAGLRRFQVFSGTCATSVTELFCSGNNNFINATGLTLGQTYLIRVYSNTGVSFGFNICITDPVPANDLCAGAITLTSAAACVNTAGTLASSTYTAIGAIGCGVAARNDVWYSFVAQSTNPTITLSSAPLNPRIQLFSGTCAALVPVSCGNGSLIAAGLTIGNTYFVRIYTDPNVYGTFNICITNPSPANDLCAGAIALTSGAACANTAGTLIGSSYTAIGAIGCGVAARNDVWYSFVAQTTNPTITLSSAPANPRIQLFSGTCAALVSVSCGNGSLTAAGLTIGNTYLVRIYTDPNVSGTFNICITDPGPANNLCAGAVTITSATLCFNTPGTLVGATYTAVANACGVVGGRNDVWYSFVANSSNPTIVLSGTLALLANQPSIQLFTNCAGTLAPAPNCVLSSATLSASGLTPGATYLVRVFSNNNTPSTFNICITDPHNLCASAVTLTSGTSCTNVPGNMYGSTITAPTTISAPDCAAAPAPTRDVWYRFVAQTINPTITLSGVGVNFTSNCRMQLLSNNCGATFTSYYCGTTSIAANHLAPGTTYFIRVYSTAAAAPITTVGWEFNICILDPVTPPPFNDNCATAVNLPIWNSCNNIPGSMAGATPSGIPLGGACAGPQAYDVWYKFTAVNTTATLTLSGIGTNFVNPRMELLSGSCGAPVSIACGVSPLAAAGLVAGSVYYIRVYSTTPPPPNGDARFNICVTTTNAPVRFGNSYVNISKKTTGGVVQPGDTLEIRMTVNHTSGTMFNLRYVDNVPTKTTMLTGGTNRIRVITNEGLMYKQYTLTAGDDAATYKAAPAAGEFNIRMNLAFGATAPGTPPNNTATEFASAAGQMASGDRPRGGGGLLFATAFRVRVTGVIGDTITLNPGQFIYKTAAGSGPDITLTATPFKILISQPYSLCTNSIGINNAAELGGTFGAGNTLTRSSDLSSPISGYSFISDVNANNAVNDGRYSIVNNISPRSGTARNARQIPQCNVPTTLAWNDPLNCNNRMFNGHWDIDGDHSGTTNAIGNVPPAAGTPSGYMLMVNADYVASEIFRQNITNLCPNTYYEFSAWIRNICQTCGIDSTGAQFAGTVTAPANGYVGVYPNLSFAMNDIDRYNTGEVDTLGWMKKGFMFRTGPTQTSAVFSIRNNSQGGGGNDWTLDDIAVATCLPTMSYSPTINPNVCIGNAILIADTVSSFFNNYTTYKWQRSVNDGASWTDVVGATTLPDTNHYITTYTVPAANTTMADSGNLYRVVVATTVANLTNPNCNISDGVTITLHVLDCGVVLDIDLLSFNGKLVNSKANLSWSTSHEDSPVKFIIERSVDGRNFLKAGESSGYNNGDITNHYSFIDPVSVVDRAWYRIAMVTATGGKKYSSIIQLYNRLTDFDVANIINPFTSGLTFDITSAENSVIISELIDMSGKIVLSMKQLVYTGTNSFTLNTQSLPAGIYTLRVVNKNRWLVKRVVKKY